MIEILLRIILRKDRATSNSTVSDLTSLHEKSMYVLCREGYLTSILSTELLLQEHGLENLSSSSSAEGPAGTSSPPYMLTFKLNCVYGGYLHAVTGKNNVIKSTV